MTIRIAFFGTPEVAVPPLEALIASRDIEVVAVVTNPDRARGRSGTAVPPPVKVAAERHGLPVLQPEKPATIVEELRAMALDACAVVAYGAILPQRVLDVGGAGFVNLHFSLLPRWRGAAPVQHAIRRGDEVTGITCFRLDAGMDTGPIISQEQVPIGAHETSGSLLDRLAAIGAPALVDAVEALAGGAEPEPQPEEGVSYAPKITREDVRIDWSADADTIHDLVRSADPAPGAHTRFRDGVLKVWRVAPVEDDAAVTAGAPGSVVARTGDGVVVACGTGAVTLLNLQPAGKARMAGDAFANGYRPDVGEVLGEDGTTGAGA